MKLCNIAANILIGAISEQLKFGPIGFKDRAVASYNM